MLRMMQLNHAGDQSSRDQYWHAMTTLYQRSNRQEAIGDWTEKEFDSQVVNVLSEKIHVGDQPLRMLGVGSSEGQLELMQIKKLQSKFPKVHSTVIEPNLKTISQYQETVKQLHEDNELTDVEHEWNSQTFQEYFGPGRTEKKYHFISIIHAIYYIGDVVEAVKNLHDMLEPGGIVFLIVYTGHTGTGKLLRTVPALSGKNPIDSIGVRSVLIESNIAFTESTYTETIDITGFGGIKKGVTPETELNKFLDGSTTNATDTAHANVEILAKLGAFIKEHRRFEVSDNGTKKKMFDTVCDIFVIPK